MNREQLIDKIKKQGGFIDYVDAYRIVDVYTELFGGFYNKNPKIEDELIYMWNEILNYQQKRLRNDEPFDGILLEGHKWCRRCNTQRQFSEFNKSSLINDGLYTYCRLCTREISKENYRKRLLKNG